ncbi:MAG TPA: amino acid adenylation domain-containing protein, partial [Thermoanaerobaculia bacterium]|nr:amino acid adenylation domain-containing protein [Thermoanaerobaculia bacterium]
MTIRTDDSAEISIHGLFEEQVERTPSAVAVAFGADSLSYAELNRRANRLAHHLRRLGVRPDGLVGLAAERSLEMVVGVLAALKAGGAYVPLDPGYPAERLSFMWQDVRSGSPAAPPVLLCQRRLSGVLPADLTEENGRRVLFLDDPAAAAAPAAPAGEGGCDENPRAEVSPDQLAYVIYTSGSTGRPKGVLVPHRGVVNVVREAARLLAVGPGSRVLQLASLGFDASALEIFTALATGACLVLTRRETLMSGEALGRELALQAVSVLAIPPSLLDTVEEEDLPALRSIIVGGEACSAATAARWSAGRTLVNAYAPTEATIFATAAPLALPITEAPAIGRPIAGIDVVLLDADGEPVADGEAGELCLGGVGVVRGYLNRSELTAERFIPDGITAGGRLYRSGDLARRLADGGLQFIGRVDHQVKIRGYRIELGEIEAVLGQHAGVQTAAVVAREDGRGTAKRLVAYVVRRREGGSGRELTVSALRSFLAGKLPDYMVPTAFVFLAAMPMTPTGKVDRRALPAPGQARPELDADFVAPRDAAEEALARIWSELLGVDPVGVHDNLFELGGHSLIAAQIANRVRDELGVELAIPEVFERPTVAALAGRLAELAAGGHADLQSAAATPTIPPIVPVPRDGPLPLSFAQERVWFLNQLSPGSVAYNFQFTLRLRGALDPPALQKALQEIVARHEILRTSFPAVGGGPVQVIHPPWEVDLPLVDLRLLPLAERQARAERLVHDEI